MSVELETREKSIKFVESTRVFKFAVSLGGVESLIEQVRSMTHSDMVVTGEVGYVPIYGSTGGLGLESIGPGFHSKSRILLALFAC